MKQAFGSISIVGLLAGMALGQPTETQSTFDIADVHVSAKTTNPNMNGGVLRGNRYELRRATMVDLIRTAYGVDADKVLGGPSWLETDRFDVIAKAPPGTPPENLKLMLQALLADRFKLTVHKDSKPLPVFVLSAGKGKPKLKEAEGSGPTGCQGQPQPPQPGAVPYQVVACHNFTMAALAEQLPRMANAYVTSTVVDQTGLKGSWDFEIKWTARGLLSQAGADGITIFDAVDRQLGLKLEAQKIPVPVIAVDSVNQKPTANPPGVVTSLPAPPPAEFEVAEIKPAMPGATGQFIRFQPNGRLDATNMPLKGLITLAWDINTDDLIAAPKWMESARFDIVAKVTTSGPVAQVDIDTLRSMLRGLLIERFKIVSHMEERPVNAYTLTPGKSKMQKADPSNRTGCKEGPGPDGKDPRIANPVLSRLITCQNMTMAQFADLLPNLANGYVRTPVQDATGLDGAWDFTLSFSAAGLLQGGVPGGRGADAGPPAGGAGASDPNGALSLPDAVNKQLGVKLELQKRPMPVLVIDRAEEKPTDN